MVKTFAVLIRAYNSADTVGALLDSLATLATKPTRIVVIDNGSTDGTAELCRQRGCEVHPYDGGDFNYSRALNQGFALIDEHFCLVVSSHVRILRTDLLDSMMTEISARNAVAAYVNFPVKDFATRTVDRENFDGWIGLWNPCALYITKYAQDMRFNEQIPTSEDIEFASRLFDSGLRTVELAGPWIAYENPRRSFRKRNNQMVAVGYYVYRKHLAPKQIYRIANRALRRLCAGNGSEAAADAALAYRMFMARYRKPRFSSRYFA